MFFMLLVIFKRFQRSIKFDRSMLTHRWQIGSGCSPCNSNITELVRTPFEVKFNNRSIYNLSAIQIDRIRWINSYDLWKIGAGFGWHVFHVIPMNHELIARMPWRILRTHSCFARMSNVFAACLACSTLQIRITICRSKYLRRMQRPASRPEHMRGSEWSVSLILLDVSHFF